ESSENTQAARKKLLPDGQVSLRPFGPSLAFAHPHTHPKPTPVRSGPSSWIMVRGAFHEFVGYAGLCASRVWLMVRRAVHQVSRARMREESGGRDQRAG